MGLLSRVLGRKVTPQVEVKEVTDETFREDVVESDLPVLMFIWSSTCPHCKKLAPNIAGVARKSLDRVKTVHMNAGVSTKVIPALKVHGVPTVIFFHRGREVQRVVGFKLQSYFEEAIEALFPPPSPEN